MKPRTYLKFFASKERALDWMRMINTAAQRAGNKRDLMVVTDGPEDNFAVMDLDSAIELGGGYTWEVA